MISQSPWSVRTVPALLVLMLAASGSAAAADDSKNPPASVRVIQQQPKAAVSNTGAQAAATAAAKAAGKDNPATSPTGGPQPAVPGLSKPSIDIKTGPGASGAADLSVTSPAADLRAGATTSGAIGSVKQRPGFDQGFSQPTFDRDAAAAVLKGSAGGDSGASSETAAPGGIVGQGKDAVSDGFFGNTKRNGDEYLKGESRPDRVYNPRGADGQPDKNVVVHEYADGSSNTITKKGASTDIVHVDADGNETKEHCVEKKTGVECKPATPGEEERYRAGKQDYLDQKLGDRNVQIKAAAHAGGTINPDRSDNSTAAGAASGVAAPVHSAVGNSLFGQPVSGGRQSGGAPRGVDFNGSSGAIDPGDDATVTAGNRQQDPGAVFNKTPQREIGDAHASTADGDADSDDGKDKTKTGK